MLLRAPARWNPKVAEVDGLWMANQQRRRLLLTHKWRQSTSQCVQHHACAIRRCSLIAVLHEQFHCPDT